MTRKLCNFQRLQLVNLVVLTVIGLLLISYCSSTEETAIIAGMYNFYYRASAYCC